MKITVIISTVNRPQDLKECLESILIQTHQPDEIILVDAYDGDDNFVLLRNILGNSDINGIHIRQERIDGKVRKTRAWNRAIESSAGDVLFFFDDDVALLKDYIAEHLNVYSSKDLGFVAAVHGFFLRDGEVIYTEASERSKFSRFFFLPGAGSGKMLCSGFPTFSTDQRNIVKIEAMGSGNMSVRKEVAEEFSFDEWFYGYSYQEDDDFSYRISRKYAIFQTPKAQMIHKRSVSGRTDIEGLYYMRALNHFYFFKKNMKKSPLSWFCFFWSELGLLWQSYRNGHKDPAFRGRLRGLKSIIRQFNIKQLTELE